MRSDRLIAIVDDSPEDRTAVRRHLTQADAGYRFLEYESAEGVAEACRANPPDCLILDYMLGGTDGLEVLDRLTGGTGLAPFAVVMLTGRGNEAVAVLALKRGAVDYAVKGAYTPDGLRQTVAEAIARFAARPWVERQRAGHERAYRATEESATYRKRIVLVVDDSPEDRMAARRALGKGGSTYRFLEEGSGAEGLALCRSAGIDCLLLDYSLPDTDGLEFLDELTGGTAITPFPVIMMTGRGDEAIAVEALKRGAVDYMIKGRYSAETLRLTVEQAIDRLSARRVDEEQRIRVLERLEAEARRRADQLAEADRLKDEFLAMLAHELRNPLAPISAALHILRMFGPFPEAAVRSLDIADRQLTHLTRLVDDLMEVSRITRGRIALRKEIVELGASVRRAVEAARPLIDSRGHEVAIAIADVPIVLYADPTRVEQVLVNLLNNAAKYTEPGGHITVAAVQEGQIAMVRVTDDGIGIDGETLPRVFDLFAQSERSLDRSLGGLGIGLTLVRAIVEQHGGTVEAMSSGPGTGSEFTVRLPTCDASEAGPTSVLVGGRPRAQLKVLLVDDNVDGNEMLAMLFKVWGYEVLTAFDGLSGLELVRAERPDVVFLDIGLPGMNGYDVARAIRAEAADYSPVLAAITGYGRTEDKRRAFEAGFRHHLVKPVNPDQLLQVIAAVEEGVDTTTDESKGSVAGGERH